VKQMFLKLEIKNCRRKYTTLRSTFNNEERAISNAQAKKLGEFFGISPAVFI